MRRTPHLQHGDPKTPSYGSADPSLPPAGPLSQDVVSRSADMTLYVVFLPVFPSQSSVAEKIASLIH
ncbi:TPA_asm: hypothetical protein G1419_21180 [Salmonella enterica]|nr:hypothetical protein [Salmonella enterica]HAD9263650.1 hypothetical protein [Salmonella enterica]